MSETQNKLGAALDIAAIHDLSDRAGSQITTLSLSTAIPGVPSTIPVFVDRKSGTVSNVTDLFERYREHPRRKSGTANVATLESLISLIDRHKTEHSAIFAETNWEKPSITAVFDYHEAKNGGLADNGKHRAHYEFPLSEEWKAWVKINGKPLEQVEFAEFIEDHIAELSAPDSFEAEDFHGKFGFKVAYPNELVALSRGLQVCCSPVRARSPGTKNTATLRATSSQCPACSSSRSPRSSWETRRAFRCGSATASPAARSSGFASSTGRTCTSPSR